jgi:hypothetical protein
MATILEVSFQDQDGLVSGHCCLHPEWLHVASLPCQNATYIVYSAFRMLQNLLVCLTHKHAQICVKEYLQWVTGHQLSCAMVVQGFMSMVAFPLIHAYNLGQTEDSPTLFLP